MKVALLAFSVRGAMGQYLEALVPPLSQHLDLSLYVPEHFEGNVPVKVVRFPTGASRAQALRRFLDPRPARTLWQKILTEKPDCLYLFNGEGYPWALWLARWAKKRVSRSSSPFMTLIPIRGTPGKPPTPSCAAGLCLWPQAYTYTLRCLWIKPGSSEPDTS